jgi:cyclic 2,3-diphosphoglycerate synthetase
MSGVMPPSRRGGENVGVSPGPVIALIDGEHHPPAVRDALDRLDAERGVAAVVFCGGEEKVPAAVLAAPEGHYGRAVASGAPAAELVRGTVRAVPDARAVVDLADEPVLDAPAKLRLAAFALHLGLDYEAPGVRLEAPRYERLALAGPVVAVIGTGKRTGKTAVAGHWAALLRERGARPVILAMGRGGPPEPVLAAAGTGLDELLAVADGGGHGASDFLEDAALAGVPAVGCRRVGGGLAGIPYDSTVAAGVRLALEQDPGTLVLEGSGSCIPPVEAGRTVCMVGDRRGALEGLGPYRLLRADLALVRTGDPTLAEEVAAVCPGRTLRFELRPEPVEPLAAGARVALFSTSAAMPDGLEPLVATTSLARREELGRDLDRARSERCDVYLTELKAAAVDTVARRAREDGARVVFLRNRPVAPDADLDAVLLGLSDRA